MNSKIWLFGLALCLVCSFTSCKSKQSAYKTAYERAKEKEPAQDVIEEVTPVSKPAATTPSYEQEVVKKEKVTAVSGSGLKRYSVVIGSFQNKTNATSLQERMQSEGFNVILAQNEALMYRVIVASYDNKPSAAAKRDEVKVQYAPAFQDAWILEQQY